IDEPEFLVVGEFGEIDPKPYRAGVRRGDTPQEDVIGAVVEGILEEILGLDARVEAAAHAEGPALVGGLGFQLLVAPLEIAKDEFAGLVREVFGDPLFRDGSKRGIESAL